MNKENKEEFAVIQTGGKQYKVSSGSLISIEKIKGEYKNVVKYKQKSRYLKRNGHRQPFFKVKITSII